MFQSKAVNSPAAVGGFGLLLLWLLTSPKNPPVAFEKSMEYTQFPELVVHFEMFEWINTGCGV
jgi:hypothetical protein